MPDADKENIGQYINQLCVIVFYRKNPFTPSIVLCVRSCAKSCALGLVRMCCAHILCGFQFFCVPQTSCARCCADVVRVLCVVFGGDCGFGTFFRVVLCALVLVSWADDPATLGAQHTLPR